MDKIKEHLETIYITSKASQNHFINKSQDELVRFVFCGIQKISKISSALLNLYKDLDDSEDLEFSIGILCRSVLMDMILVMGIKKIYFQFDGQNYEDIKEKIKVYSLKMINDGTKYFIDEIHSSEKLSEEQKKEYSLRFTSLFSKAFDHTGDKPKLKKDFNYKLIEIYKDSKDPKMITGEAIYNLYSYYSKYDHLSHWTSLSQHIPFEQRKGKLDLSIILMVMHLRELLSIAYDFTDEYKILLPYIEELHKHLDENWVAQSA